MMVTAAQISGTLNVGQALPLFDKCPQVFGTGFDKWSRGS